jgi:hypothetical protein
LRVLVTALAIEDGQTPPPEVGQERLWTLEFFEAEGDAPDTTVTSVEALAEPEAPPMEPGPCEMGERPGERTVWPTRLTGFDWSATWWARRPVTGRVALRGRLTNDLHGYLGVTAGVRGRVTRVQVVVETYRPGPGRHRIAHLQRTREMDVAPRWFDNGLVPDLPAGPVPSGWYPMKSPDVPYTAETGVLIDLDRTVDALRDG